MATATGEERKGPLVTHAWGPLDGPAEVPVCGQAENTAWTAAFRKNPALARNTKALKNFFFV